MTSAPAKPEPKKGEITLFDKAKGFLSKDDLKRQIAVALPKHLTPDRMLRVALTAVMSSPKLQECFQSVVGQASVAKALLTASQLGLEVDGRQGHLVPFRDNKANAMLCQFIPGYQGFVQLAYNHPSVKSIWWNVVRENDEFVYEDGLDRRLVHKKFQGPSEQRGELTHAYAVCQMDGGAKTFVCLDKWDVLRAKKSSKSADSSYSPWTTHEEAMWAKTAVRALSKQMPQCNELRRALEVDDEAERVDEERFASAKPVFSEATASVITPDATPEQSAPANSDEQAEADAGLAPARQPTVTPPTAPPTVPEPPSQTSEHAELTAFLGANGLGYQQLQEWAKKSEFYPNADTYGTIDELPIAVVRKLLNSKTGLLGQLKARK